MIINTFCLRFIFTLKKTIDSHSILLVDLYRLLTIWTWKQLLWRNEKKEKKKLEKNRWSWCVIKKWTESKVIGFFLLLLLSMSKSTRTTMKKIMKKKEIAIETHLWWNRWNNDGQPSYNGCRSQPHFYSVN